MCWELSDIRVLDYSIVDLRWIESLGGPLLLVPESVLDQWSGSEGKSASHLFPNDYEWACSLTDYLAPIEVGGATALVLGDEPLPTAWVSQPTGGFFARWSYCPDDAHAAAVLQTVPKGSELLEEVQFGVESTAFRLVDAAETGSSLQQENVTVSPTIGSYSVQTFEFEPDEESSFRTHRLCRT